jgi:hypothetical protein
MNPRIPQIIADLTQLESKLRHSKTAEETAKQLATIKAYAAELYLETDMEIIAHNSAAISTPQPINEISEETHPLFKPSYEDDVLTSEEPTLINPPITESAIPNAELSGEASSNLVAPEETEPLGAPELVEEDESQAPINEAEESKFENDFDLEVDEDDNEVEQDEDGEEDDFQIDDDDDEVDQNEDFEENPESHVTQPQESTDLEQSDRENHEKDLHNSQNISPESANTTTPIYTEPTKLDLFSMQEEVIENEEDEQGMSVEKPHLEHRANEILSMFSFSRRFEFGNFLFGGDMKLFTVFITEMLAAGNSEEREDVFDTWYNQRQWSRRDESANDLKRNLRKMM